MTTQAPGPAVVISREDADPQEPHDRDEIYVVASGSAVFFDGDRRTPVGGH